MARFLVVVEETRYWNVMVDVEGEDPDATAEAENKASDMVTQGLFAEPDSSTGPVATSAQRVG